MPKFSKIGLCATLPEAPFFTLLSKNHHETRVITKSIFARFGSRTLVTNYEASTVLMIEQSRLSYRKVINTTINLIITDIKNNASGNLSIPFTPLLGEHEACNTNNLAELVENLTDFFSYNTNSTGDVNVYSSTSMVNTHNPEVNTRKSDKDNTANYNIFEGYVAAAALQNGVATSTQLYADVVAVLESLRAPIVKQ